MKWLAFALLSLAAFFAGASVVTQEVVMARSDGTLTSSYAASVSDLQNYAVGMNTVSVLSTNEFMLAYRNTDGQLVAFMWYLGSNVWYFGGQAATATLAGNSNKLDGHDSSYFATSSGADYLPATYNLAQYDAYCVSGHTWFFSDLTAGEGIHIGGSGKLLIKDGSTSTSTERDVYRFIGWDGNGTCSSDLKIDDSDILTQNLADSLYASSSELSDKADKVIGSQLNDVFAALDANGNLKSSGKKASDFVTSSALNGYLSKSGGDMSGDINFDNGGAGIVFGYSGGGLSFEQTDGTRISIWNDEDEYSGKLVFHISNEDSEEPIDESSILTIDGSPILTEDAGDGRYATSTALSGKATKVSGATNGNFASLTNHGDLQDSGKKAADFAPAVEGGYLPLSAGDYYSLNGDLWIGVDERTAQDAHRIVFATDKYPCYIKATEKNTTGQSKFVFGMEDDEDYDSSLTPDGSPVLTATKATTDYPIITHAASEFASAAPDTNGYLPRSAGENYPLTGQLYLNDSNCYLYGNNDSGGFLWIVANAIAFSDGSGPGTRSDIFPDGTPVMTEGKADYHIVSNATVTSGQIANVDLAGLSCKTVNVNFASATTKAGDALLWTGGNTEDCTMVFSVTPNTLVPHGDDGYLKATANKKCLFMFDKVSATDIIITKKEFN